MRKNENLGILQIHVNYITWDPNGWRKVVCVNHSAEAASNVNVEAVAIG